MADQKFSTTSNDDLPFVHHFETGYMTTEARTKQAFEIISCIEGLASIERNLGLHEEESGIKGWYSARYSSLIVESIKQLGDLQSHILGTLCDDIENKKHDKSSVLEKDNIDLSNANCKTPLTDGDRDQLYTAIRSLAGVLERQLELIRG